MTPVAECVIANQPSPAIMESNIIFMNGGGGDGGGFSSTVESATSVNAPSSGSNVFPTTRNDHNATSQQQQHHKSTPTTNPSQKEHASGLSYKDREDRVRQLRDRQQLERQQKLEELKEQAAAAQRFREQQETARRQRLDDMRSKDFERRTQVEERKRLIQQAEQQRREAVIRKGAEREQRLEHKRRQERSNAVFAFGSSTPRMLDPKENNNYWGSRRATSTSNVNMSDSTASIRRSSECQESDLSRKRATSAHSLNRKPDDVRMSTSMYEVFNWDDDDVPASCKSQVPGDDPIQPRAAAMVSTAARRRTDLVPSMPSSRDSRHRSPGRALSLDQLSSKAGRHARTNTPSLAPLHESPRTNRISSMSKSMSHLGPHRARTPIGPATDGAGVPVVQGSLDRRSSRSSLALAQPRKTRSEMLRQKLREANRNSDGIRSGINTPSSRPTSALSHVSGSSQVMLRNKSSPKKPRPLSIAGSVPSSADKPRHLATASPLRESRSIERKNSASGSKPATSAPNSYRAKSVGSDRSAPSTPSKARGMTPKRTPAQVKADSAARKASKARIAAKAASTPARSPSAESKPLVGEKKPKSSPQSSTVSNKPASKDSSQTDIEIVTDENDKIDVTIEAKEEEEKIEVESKIEQEPSLPDSQEIVSTNEVDVSNETVSIKETSPTVEVPKDDNDEEKSRLQKAAEKPVTGYATEEEYKAALAEKRRQAREAKEKELELERQKQLEEEERERREEEEYLEMIEEQKKAEEVRLQKAIQEAEKQREVDKIKAEEEEKLRLEAEKIEQQKKLEAEERAKKEEEERQLRKSRVAAIMSRTRGKGTTPTKTEPKISGDETAKNVMTESFISNISSSMTDSMIVQAIESREESKEASSNLCNQSISESSDAQTSNLLSLDVSTTQPISDVSSQPSDISSQPPSDISSQPPSDVSSQPPSDVSSQPPSDVSSQAVITVELSSQPSSGVHSDCGSLLSQDAEKEETLHLNGNCPMDTTPTLDLLGGSLNGVNGINHNGVRTSDTPDNLFGSLDPLNSQTTTTSSSKSETTFDQIIDLNQSKLSNEDAVNRNSAPHPPIIAFEDNLNKKCNQEKSSNVPDLLL